MRKIEGLLESLRRIAGLSRPARDPGAPTSSSIAVAEHEPEPAAEPFAIRPEAAAPTATEPDVPEGESFVPETVPIEEPAIPAAAVANASASGGVLLRLESEREGTPTFDVAKSGATIGRGPENTIRLTDLSVSRKHAKITYRQGAYWLSDLGSMGGTWVDGTKLATPRRIETGQVIDIGACRMTVADAPSGEDGVVESGAARRRR